MNTDNFIQISKCKGEISCYLICKELIDDEEGAFDTLAPRIRCEMHRIGNRVATYSAATITAAYRLAKADMDTVKEIK